MSKKVLILIGDAVESLEIYYPYYRCLEEGYDTTIAASTVKKIHTVVHDFTDWETYTEKPGYLIDAQIAFADINPEEYEGLIIPGGRAPEHIRLNEHVPKIVSHFFEQDKPVAAVCHGSLVLTTVKEHLKNRAITAYIACKPEVEAAGCTYIEAHLHVDRNLVSGHAWPDLPAVMKEFINLLEES
ncbi:DJ-1/PfpI family protein [Virgibacillus sp. W0430]|uniref:DJ-1/PfpI family protein n=1 Tax=Virgibacillus sp. W0430 TaxID=3391580 RepID=UPI003F44DC08